jgi:Nucleoside-diphosphate-sugar pyrophosphorylase involved in lipopolysaccharide biosynthesis/translation initiation factor 2B, gamma/epsilon subunits (eIF-2Bgamma/eIF-2Bepsilon)
MKAMIFAAGLGTRLKPITDSIPKALVSVGNRPLLDRQVETLKMYGFKDIVINVHHFAHLIKEYLAEHNNFDVNISISDESDLLRETGGD